MMQLTENALQKQMHNNRETTTRKQRVLSPLSYHRVTESCTLSSAVCFACVLGVSPLSLLPLMINGAAW